MESPSLIGNRHLRVTLALPNGRSFADRDDRLDVARSLVDAWREPVLLLDRNLRVIAASRAYCQTFAADWREVPGRRVFALGGGLWNISEVRWLLERIVARKARTGSCEIEQDIPGIGRRSLLLDMREAFQEGRTHTLFLLVIEDVSDRRAAEREPTRIVRQTEILLQANQHQIANSLQIIASILQLKARTAQSEETRDDLQNVHARIMSVATVQQQLLGTKYDGQISLAPYLYRLCDTLADSMIGDRIPISIVTRADGRMVSATEAVSIGLIVTELIINAIKHAFVDDPAAGRIDVTYDVAGNDWRLAVSDNGVGTPVSPRAATPGLGKTIVEALSRQLDCCLDTATGMRGTTVSINHSALRSVRLAEAL